jgi:hypothetical protein
MSARLWRYLAESYLVEKDFLREMESMDSTIQIDDMEDHDDLTQFCALFVTVGKRDDFVFEALGGIPLSQELVDLVEIYGGTVEREPCRVVVSLTTAQIEVLTDFAGHIKKTSRAAGIIENRNWQHISARTISSIYRFVRIIKEYSLTRPPIRGSRYTNGQEATP